MVCSLKQKDTFSEDTEVWQMNQLASDWLISTPKLNLLLLKMCKLIFFW